MLEIKGVFCSDILDMSVPWTEHPSSFAMPFQFLIGKVGEEAAVTSLVERMVAFGNTLNDPEAYLSKMLDWEFENYKA